MKAWPYNHALRTASRMSECICVYLTAAVHQPSMVYTTSFLAPGWHVISGVRAPGQGLLGTGSRFTMPASVSSSTYNPLSPSHSFTLIIPQSLIEPFRLLPSSDSRVDPPTKPTREHSEPRSQQERHTYTMFSKATTLFALFAAAAHFVVATPPACLIGAMR